MLATFVDDTAITSTNSDINSVIKNFQDQLIKLRGWYNL